MGTRRQLLLTGGRVALVGLLAACAGPEPRQRDEGAGRESAAELTARPGSGDAVRPSGPAPGAGEHRLGLAEEGDPVLYVPPDLPAAPVPLVVTLHGAGGDAAGGLTLFRRPADERGLLLLAPASRGATWDAIRDGYGPDADLVDRALARVFSMVATDPERIAIAGFSDGASYALGLGLANGGLFGRILAFSPGSVPAGPRTGDPEVFVSHGDADQVLPVDRTSRRIVPALEDDGYGVTYREFPGGHGVPLEIAQAGADWLGWTRPR